MKYAIIDTETSCLFDFTKPADAPGQVRLASLAIITVDTGFSSLTDEPLPAIEEHAFLIRPDGWKMAPEATVVNGFTDEFLYANGEPVAVALEKYASLIDSGFVIVAFNAQFDTKVMRGELRRAGLPDRFESTPNICVMRAATNVCRVPKKTGSGYKFPKLAEACAFFKITQDAAHTAMGDARSALAIFRELHTANLLPVPEVHFAKQAPTSKPSPAIDLAP